MRDTNSAPILILASGLDYLLGDPWGWIHPVGILGHIITLCTKIILARTEKKFIRRLAGILLGAGLIMSGGAIAWRFFRWLNPIALIVSLALQVILLASCFAGKSLRNAAIDVLTPLQSDDLPLARSRLGLYVGRDTEELSASEILRAILETVSENAVDGVTAPLFYALLGTFLGVGPVPLAIAYKISSTLDSMIGYRRQPYGDIGWFSARVEDYLTWFPCRLTVLTLAFFSGKPRSILAICCRDAPRDPSPNSGWSECVYAAILGVRLGGENRYQGVVTIKPFLGDDIEPITADTVDRALNLTRWCFLLWLALSLPIILAR